MQTHDGLTYYFINLEPFDCHPADDRRAMLLRAAKLHVVSSVRQADIMNAFEVSRPTVARAVSRYRKHGEDAFFEPRRGRGRTVVDSQMADQAANLLASGMSGSACARQLGIPASTFNENRRAGVIAAPAGARATVADAPPPAAATDHPANAGARQTDPAPATDHPATAGAPQTDPAPPTDRATRDARDKQAPMGRAARDVEGRMLASAGLINEAKPEFASPAHAVARGGVLAALPMLLREGLLGAANRLFRLPAGFYGLTHHPPVRRLHDAGPGTQPRGPPLPSARRVGRDPRPRPLPRDQDPTPQAQAARQRRAHRPRLAIGAGTHLGHRARGRLGDAGRGWPREGIHRAQRSAAETLSSRARSCVCQRP